MPTRTLYATGITDATEVDSGKTHLLVFDGDTGEFIDDVYTSDSAQSYQGSYMAAGPSGRVYLMDGVLGSDPRVFVFEADGTPVTDFSILDGMGTIRNDVPLAVTVDSRIFTSNEFGTIFSPHTEVFEWNISGALIDSWELPSPDNNIALGIYVSDDILFYTAASDNFSDLGNIYRYDLLADAPLSNLVTGVTWEGNPQFNNSYQLRRDSDDTGYLFPTSSGLVIVSDAGTPTAKVFPNSDIPHLNAERGGQLYGATAVSGIYCTYTAGEPVFNIPALTDFGMQLTYPSNVLVTGPSSSGPPPPPPEPSVTGSSRWRLHRFDLISRAEGHS